MTGGAGGSGVVGGAGAADEVSSYEGVVETFASHMNDVLYGKFGYYSSGKVVISNGTKAGDFYTHGSAGIALPLIITNYIHNTYKAQLADATRSEAVLTPFTVVELSGGNGDLACAILGYLKLLAGTGLTFYKDLYESLDYVIYEISPVLAEKQAHRCAEFMVDGPDKKLTIENRSALTLDHASIDFLHSNELWDALPFEYIKRTLTGEFEVQAVLAFTPERRADNHSSLEMLGRESVNDKGHFYIDQPTLQSVQLAMKDMKQWEAFASKLSFETCWLPLAHFPALKRRLLEEAKMLMDDLDPDVAHPISPDLIDLAKKINAVSPHTQFHGDYADYIDHGVRGTARMYGAGEKAIHQPYDLRYGVDVTVNVDWKMMITLVRGEAALDEYLCGYHVNAVIPINACLINSISAIAGQQSVLETGPDKKFIDYVFKIKAALKGYVADMGGFKVFIATKSKCLCLRDDTHPIWVYSEVPAVYPGAAMNPISNGIPAGRSFIQAKAHEEGTLVIPADDIHRMSEWLSMHPLYNGKAFPKKHTPEEWAALQAKGKVQGMLAHSLFSTKKTKDDGESAALGVRVSVATRR